MYQKEDNLFQRRKKRSYFVPKQKKKMQPNSSTPTPHHYLPIFLKNNLLSILKAILQTKEISAWFKLTTFFLVKRHQTNTRKANTSVPTNQTDVIPTTSYLSKKTWLMVNYRNILILVEKLDRFIGASSQANNQVHNLGLIKILYFAPRLMPRKFSSSSVILLPFWINAI